MKGNVKKSNSVVLSDNKNELHTKKKKKKPRAARKVAQGPILGKGCGCDLQKDLQTERYALCPTSPSTPVACGQGVLENTSLPFTECPRDGQEESTYQCRKRGFDPWVRIPGGENGNSNPVFTDLSECWHTSLKMKIPLWRRRKSHL